MIWVDVKIVNGGGVDFEGACDKVGNIQATENASRLFVLYADADDNQGLE